MDKNDRSYKSAEQHYKDRMEIYEDRENKILKQRITYKNNKQRRVNLLFILPVILLAVLVFPKIINHYENKGISSEEKNYESVKEIIDYLELSKSSESSTAAILKLYSDNETINTDIVKAQIEQVNAVFNSLSTEKIPSGFEEYNEYELYILATDIELLKVLCEERTPDMENYFNTMVQRRNSLSGHRRDCMKAVLDNIDGIKYTENENGINIEYYY